MYLPFCCRYVTYHHTDCCTFTYSSNKKSLLYHQTSSSIFKIGLVYFKINLFIKQLIIILHNLKWYYEIYKLEY